jgi:hypothetical protein
MEQYVTAELGPRENPPGKTQFLIRTGTPTKPAGYLRPGISVSLATAWAREWTCSFS